MASPSLTVAEVRGLIVSLGLTGLTAAEIADLTAGINTESAGALERLTAHFVAALGPNPLPAALRKAERLAESHARDMLLDLTKSALSSMGDTIARGMENGLGPRDIARELEQVRGLDSVRAARMEKYIDYLDAQDLTPDEWERRFETQFQRELRDRRLTIARTEQRRATGEANRANAEARGAQFKVWITAGDERVSDECRENEAAGWIDIEDTFPSGADTPPQHPNCRCTVSYRTAEPSAAERERAESRAAVTAAATGAEDEGE